MKKGSSKAAGDANGSGGVKQPVSSSIRIADATAGSTAALEW